MNLHTKLVINYVLMSKRLLLCHDNSNYVCINNIKITTYVFDSRDHHRFLI